MGRSGVVGRCRLHGHRMAGSLSNPSVRPTFKRGEKSMERRSFLKHSGLAGILAAASAPAIAQTSGEVKWRLASSFPKSLDTIFGAAETISKRVAASSNNKFQ